MSHLHAAPPSLLSLCRTLAPPHSQDEALGLFSELQRQARAAPRFEAQIAAASQRVEELEEQVQELHSENQALASGHQGLGGGLRSGPGVGHGGHYADDAGLAMSALEQQLALSESARGDAQAAAEAGARENARLAAELGRLQAALDADGAGVGALSGYDKVGVLFALGVLSGVGRAATRLGGDGVGDQTGNRSSVPAAHPAYHHALFGAVLWGCGRRAGMQRAQQSR